MATWNVYIEYQGYPLYAEVELDDDYEEDNVYDIVLEDLIIEVTRDSD